ncbi:MAG: HlyD family efflux transporter periplasmic adaptor subunit [Burkholderiales bacterium]|nr:HlyD family efflux transporter periplasmic adaptor subunit [Burkholderiales bacterium]
MNKRIILPVALGVLLLAGAIGAWTARTPAPDPDRLTLYGNVDIRQVSLAFNASDRIAALLVDEGDRVKTGQVLGRLDDTTARLRLEQNQAQIGVQQEALKRLKSGSRPEEIAQARANLAAAEAEAGLAKNQRERLKATADATQGKGVARQDLDNAAWREKAAQAQAEAARKAAQLVAAGPRKEDIAQAEKQLAYARAQQALLQRQIDESQLLAPVDAVVRARLLEPGDMASPQRPVFTLALTHPKWVRAYVDETRLGRLHPGMAATVSTDAAPGQALAAKLGYISSVAEFTPKSVQTPELRTSLVYELRFLVDDPKDELRLGMPATVELKLQDKPQAGAAS